MWCCIVDRIHPNLEPLFEPLLNATSLLCWSPRYPFFKLSLYLLFFLALFLHRSVFGIMESTVKRVVPVSSLIPVRLIRVPWSHLEKPGEGLLVSQNHIAIGTGCYVEETRLKGTWSGIDWECLSEWDERTMVALQAARRCILKGGWTCEEVKIQMSYVELVEKGKSFGQQSGHSFCSHSAVCDPS